MGVYPNELKIKSQRDTCTPVFIAAVFTVAERQKPPRSSSSKEWINTIQTMKYYSALRRNSEKAMAPPSSTLAWKIPWMEEPGRLQSMGSLESDMTERLHFHFSLSCIGEGNGNSLQCS